MARAGEGGSTLAELHIVVHSSVLCISTWPLKVGTTFFMVCRRYCRLFWFLFSCEDSRCSFFRACLVATVQKCNIFTAPLKTECCSVAASTFFDSAEEKPNTETQRCGANVQVRQQSIKHTVVTRCVCHRCVRSSAVPPSVNYFVSCTWGVTFCCLVLERLSENFPFREKGTVDVKSLELISINN